MTPDEHPNREALDALFRSDAHARRLGAELVDWGGGWAEVALDPDDTHVNFAGSVHGGVLFSLADLAFAVACNAWGRASVALTVEVHFLAAAVPGTRLLATARERSLTRRTGSYLLEVHAEGTLVASLHAMAYRTGRWHLGEDAWTDHWRASH